METNTSSAFRIDDRVFLTMTFFSVLSFLTLVYSFQTDKPCAPIKLSFKSADYYPGSLILFKAETNHGETYEWNFGDGERSGLNGSSMAHAYNAPGNYTVYVIVNGKCEEKVNVIISERPFTEVKDLAPKFICPDVVNVNELVKFTDTTHGATSWEWFFDETGSVNRTTRQASWIFASTGLKTVHLRVNGKPVMEATRNIRVIDPVSSSESKYKDRRNGNGGYALPNIIVIPEKPKSDSINNQEPVPPPQPEARKRAPDIQSDEMETLLESVVTGNKTAQDFSKYLCDDLNIPVVYNNEHITFSEMCNRLNHYKSLNRIKRPSVKLAKSESTGCIIELTVSVSKRTLVDKILGRKN